LDLKQLLLQTLHNKASDLHLSPGNKPVNRVHGDLRRLDGETLTGDSIRAMLRGIMDEDQRKIYEQELELDFAISLDNAARFRVNAFNTLNGAAAVFRTVAMTVPTMEQLKLPAVLKRFAGLERGLVLVTGPTGSGKSTTLAAMVDHINGTMDKHIITIEDPVEYIHTSKRCLINHREVGRDTHSFTRALKSALREDPDVILVGEMRDRETIALALTAAETGHLVLGTLHASSAHKTVDRIIDVFPQGDKDMVRTMLSGSLQGVVSQTLLKRADGNGITGAFEILVGTNAARNLIRENQIAQLFSIMQTGMKYSMVTMEDSIKALVANGTVSAEEARHAMARVTEEGEFENTKPGAAGGEKAGGNENYAF
jgi:twitching motility protein PilT